MRVICLLVAGFLCLASSLIAQDVTVEAGTQVRVRSLDDSEPIIGSLIGIGADTCYVESTDSTTPWQLSLSSIEQFEVNRGTKSKLWLGAGIGFAAGFIPMFAACTSGGCGDQEDYGACCVAYGSLAGLGGGLIGALIGSAFRTVQWEEIPVENVQVTIYGLPTGQFSLVASVPFQ